MASRRGMFLRVTLLESAGSRGQFMEADGDIWTWEGLGHPVDNAAASRQPAGSAAVRRMTGPLPR
jgi:hypothetical protein